MIRSRRTTKNCNICGQEVAVLGIFKFETTHNYVTLRKDNWSMIGSTDKEEVHICSSCWVRMQEVVKRNLERLEGRL